MPQLVTPGGASRQQPVTAQVIDVGRDPALKSALLSGRLQNLTAPFMYHDPSKQLAYVLMPMELGMRDMEQQRIIGQMTQAVMRSLPEAAPRGYLLQPRMFFSFQSLIEAILEQDGITPDMLKEQQARADLIRDWMRLSDEEALRKSVRENDAKVDGNLLELLNASIEANIEAGREQAAQGLAGLQRVLVEETTYGKVLGARMASVEALRKNPTREVLIEQLVNAPDQETREALVAMGRQLIDYLFFQILTGRVDAATGDEKQKLVNLRKEVQDIRDKLDAASRALMEQKTQLINAILASSKPEEVARQREAEIDDVFMSMLQSNMQEAQQRHDEELLKALMGVYQITMQIMSERQPPEIQMINALLMAKYPDETKQLLQEMAKSLDDRFIQVMIQVADQLSQEDRTDLGAKLTQVMVQARDILPKYDPSKDTGAGPAANQPEPNTPAKPKIEIARR
ncbi:MAG: hypothetical protein M1434_04220 [Chloroflexi bacterium]|nr:hypothetical protein [Chloroflexota bacterium]MCL5273938.1 hypothetical protein [Chloroflexota bacterium]